MHQVLKNARLVKVLRWSYTVPILCYILFILMTWMLTVPLRPRVKPPNPDSPLEDSFEIRIKNSNFNSDRNFVEPVAEKNEYLVNVNAVENARKGQTQILIEVFKQ